MRHPSTADVTAKSWYRPAGPSSASACAVRACHSMGLGGDRGVVATPLNNPYWVLVLTNNMSWLLYKNSQQA